ncbi:MAG: transcription-repair coupling factor [Gammaproteobacteria bacterium]
MNLALEKITFSNGSAKQLAPLKTSADALTYALLSSAELRPLVVICHDTQTMHRLAREIAHFVSQPTDIVTLDDWETLPYDLFSPHQDIISNRLKTLYHLPQMNQGVILIPVSTLIQKLPPQSYLQQHSLMINKGDHLDMLTMRERLISAGYFAVDKVLEHGEFATRGSLLDMFPMGSELPFRIDFFDDEVDSIRTFDTETQRTISNVDAIQLLPAHEFPTDETGIRQFRKQWRELFDTGDKDGLYQRVSDGELPAGIEYYLPLFHEQLATLFDYLPDDYLLVVDDKLQPTMETEWGEILTRYEQRRHDVSRPIVTPESLYIRPEEINQTIKPLERLSFGDKYREQLIATDSVLDVSVDHTKSDPLAKLKTFHDRLSGTTILCADSNGRRESLINLCRKYNLAIQTVDSWTEAYNTAQTEPSTEMLILVAPLNAGFVLPALNLAVISETNLFGQQQTRQQSKNERRIDADAIIKNLAELKPGDAVVHVDHGIGRYNGLETLVTDGLEAEYLMLLYADDDKLYVPVQLLHMISRYSGAKDDSTPLHRLGSAQWSKAKQKAADKARDVAAELLDIYARRAAKPGLSYSLTADDYSRFAAQFGFETTADQQSAIEAVIADLQAPKPMDRLVCGDVGFGKTEVALRAAFVVTQNVKQVAVLVPTTLLAQQHYESFTDRFADWPIRIEMLSRFKTAKEQTTIMKAVEAGKVDIIIGTHKLLSDALVFANLGLVVIDEEHRFGVTQKEKIKRLRAEVDVLTLTATPIPRTLNMSFAGIRDLSIIASPPARRLAIKTFVREYNDSLIREAVIREIHRGGQVYFLHNDVASIDKKAAELEKLIPEARIGIGHGQMREKQLEQVMQDFYHQRFNVLVCSTIIETGIDVPTANTIIIKRADKFGLAQLHQLRGRVGRSHHQAYAFLLTPPKRRLTRDAEKRLDAIESFTDLGAGFVLATQDMEIRGAGELLGDEQSGQIQSVGFTMYMELLESAVQALKEGKEPSLQASLATQTEIDLSASSLIPEDYIADVGMRLSFYKRIAHAKTVAELDAIQVELIDRFGLLPEHAKTLFRIAELKRVTTPYGITKVQVDDESGAIDFRADAPIDPMSLISLMQAGFYDCRMSGPSRLLFNHECDDIEQKCQVIENICGKLKIND